MTTQVDNTPTSGTSSNTTSTPSVSSENFILLIINIVIASGLEPQQDIMKGVGNVENAENQIISDISQINIWLSSLEQESVSCDGNKTDIQNWVGANIDGLLTPLKNLMGNNPGNPTYADLIITYDGVKYYPNPTGNGTCTWSTKEPSYWANIEDKGCGDLALYQYYQTYNAVAKSDATNTVPATPPANLTGLFNPASDPLMQSFVNGIYQDIWAATPSPSNSSKTLAQDIDYALQFDWNGTTFQGSPDALINDLTDFGVDYNNNSQSNVLTNMQQAFNQMNSMATSNQSMQGAQIQQSTSILQVDLQAGKGIEKSGEQANQTTVNNEKSS